MRPGITPYLVKRTNSRDRFTVRQKGSPETGDITPVFFNHFERCNCTEGNKRQKRYSKLLRESQFRNSQAVLLNKGAFISCICDTAFIDCKYQILVWYFHYRNKILHCFRSLRNRSALYCSNYLLYIWGAHWVDVKAAMRDRGKMKLNDAWPHKDPNQQP